MKTAPRLLSILLLLLPFATRSQSLSLNVADAETGKVYLQKLDVDVKVTGNIASTTWTMIFRNETSRQLEGELNFPLADGITVSRYAIDINGRLREAVPVDKAKGTTVLEAIENRRVDPGLLERVEGNAFRTRIYPLPPNGTRTVVIGYEETLHGRTVGQLDYTLPLSFARAVPKIEIRVSSFSGSKAATGEGFDKQGTSWSATKTLTDYQSGQPLQFRIPQSGTETALMEASGNHYYTLINTPSKTGSRKRALPGDISIVWDASLSRLNRNAKAELDLLDAYLRKVRNARINLVVFSNSIQSSRAFSVTNGNWAELRSAIGGIIYDGGTGLGALDFGKLSGKEILLFSDGLNTYGAGSLKKSAIPVFAISSNTHSDFGALRGTAHSSGGALIDLSSRPLAEAITALTKQELQLLRIKGDHDIEEVYPDAPVAAAGGVAITAISHKAKGSVVLQYGYGKEVTQEVRVALDADAQKAPGANLGRIWAMNKIAALDGAYEQNRSVIEQLGRRFRLVTRNTSLIVLENLSDYLQYGIEPPEELREAYRQQLKARGTQVAAAVKNRLEDAEETFEELIEWWRGKPARVKTPQPIINGSIQGQIKGRRGQSVSNVNVQLYKGEQLQANTVTGADGNFRLYSLPPGSYRLKASYMNKERLSENVRIVANRSRQLNRTIRLSASEQLALSRPYNTRPHNTRPSKLGNATITGTLKDERGNPVVNAHVELISGRVIQGRELTDFDGNYTIRPLPGGKYNVQFKFQGKELLITDVSLAIDQTRIVNGILNSGRNLNEVTVQSRRYVAPLIDPKEPGGRSVKTAEQIERAATRNSLDIAALSTQTYQQSRGEGISIGGGRTSGTKVIIDGVQQNPGAAAFMNQNARPAAGYQFNSGVAARYGDASGGIVNENASTTETASDRYAAGIPMPSYAFDPELLGVLRSVPSEAQYAKYLELRDSSMHVPAFYFQASAHFIATGRKELGLRILSNLAELDLENYEMMKALGYKLRELGETDAAAAAFHKVVRWRPMEPQSLRDYGLALADQGRYGAALDTLYAALTGRIDAELADDYAGIEEVLLCDINALLRAHGNTAMRGRIPRQIVRPLSADIRVVVNWNMKDTDIDLWITDPDGERCDYSNSETAAGGRISNDMTDGFGPEQFLLRKAIPGTYTVEIDYFGSDAVKISGPTVVSAEIYTHWGTSKEQRQMITMQMKPTDKGGVLVGEFQFGKTLAARSTARKQRN